MRVIPGKAALPIPRRVVDRPQDSRRQSADCRGAAMAVESAPRREADVLTLAWKKQNPVNKKRPVLTAKKSNVSGGSGRLLCIRTRKRKPAGRPVARYFGLGVIATREERFKRASGLLRYLRRYLAGRTLQFWP